MEPTFAEFRDLHQEREEFEHSLTKLQEELEAGSTNELEWQSLRLTRIQVARRVSHESHEAVVEGSNRRRSSFEFTFEEVRRTSSAVEIGHALNNLDERQENGVGNLDKEQSEDRRQEQRMHSTSAPSRGALTCSRRSVETSPCRTSLSDRTRDACT